MRASSSAKGQLFRISAILYLFCWLLGIMLVFFLSFLQPTQNGMRPRHLAMLWPLFAFFPIFLSRLLSRRQQYLFLSIFFCVMILFSIFMTSFLVNQMNRARPNLASDSCDAVLLDTVQRGRLIPILWHIPDSARIFAGSQSYLLRHKEAWLENFDRGIYVSATDYGNTTEQRKTILGILNQHHHITPLPSPGWNYGTCYLVEP
jgi:hypothetical protein